MSIEWFNILSFSALALWSAGALFGYRDSRPKATTLTGAGLTVFAMAIIIRWICIGRPPFATLGETRMWYAMLLPMVGLIIYLRHHYRLILCYTTLMSAVFIVLNAVNPLNFSRDLMPALHSPWFIPHVALYMLAYALLGSATMMGVYLLWRGSFNGSARIIRSCDSLATTGTAFLTLGMLTGAVWANEAWGHYWTWDPKEIWAAATWLTYIMYIHLRHTYPKKAVLGTVVLIVGFLLLQMCWWGINVIPSLGVNSMHAYG